MSSKYSSNLYTLPVCVTTPSRFHFLQLSCCEQPSTLLAPATQHRHRQPGAAVKVTIAAAESMPVQGANTLQGQPQTKTADPAERTHASWIKSFPAVRAMGKNTQMLQAES